MSPLVTEDDIQAVTDQMRSFWISRGDRVAELEEVMRDWVSCGYSLALGSGTAALITALKSFDSPFASYPLDCCDAVKEAVTLSGKTYGDGVKIAIYPDMDGDIVDFARHLPIWHEVQLKGTGIFSFGALKDVSGGVGGCVVSNEPISQELVKVSRISDINAAMILSQLDRYQGKDDRLVAGGKIWRL